MYYNTNEEDGPELRESWARTAKQNDLILMIFQDNPNETFTPDQIQHLCEVCEREWPITSIRRAISTLTKAGNLTKTSELRKGKYGKQTHTWQYRSQVRTDINDTNPLGSGSNRF